MREGKPSRTALGAARHRAVHQVLEGGRIFPDPLAAAILGEDAKAPPEERSPLRILIAIRHRYGEDCLAASVARGSRQVVVLGAGLDTFAYRNPFPGVRVWEVDFPATQVWKRERLATAGIAVPAGSVTYAGIDFETEELLPVLAAAGLDTGAPTFFLWMGVVPYLTHTATASTLAAIGAVPGGEVVFDYSSPVAEDEAALRNALAARVAAAGEPLTEPWDPQALHDVLRSSSLTEIEDMGRQEYRSRYLGMPPGEAGGGAHVVHARRPR